MSELVLEKNIELPKGWIKSDLGIISEIIMGQAPKSVFYNYVGKGDVFVKVGEFGETHPKKIVWTTKPLRHAQKNDVLVCVVGATIGKINFGIDCAIGRSVSAIRPTKIILQKFLFYFLKPMLLKIRKDQQGSAQGVIGKPYLENLTVLLPPLNEQKRIIIKIEELFLKLNNVQIILDNIHVQLKQYRQSLLSTSLQDLSKNFTSEKLNNLCTKITDGTHFTPNYIQNGIPFISVKDIRNESIHFDNCKYISQESHDNLIKRCNPEMDDLLITKSGTIGRMAIVNTKTPFSLFVSVALIKPNKNINRNYLKYIFQNFFNHIDISQQIKGGVIKNFHLEDIREVMIPMPSDDIQIKIVSEINQQFLLVEGIENVINSMLLQLNTLRSTILKQAFEGKLVPQDPNDEPVEILLQKIIQEKEQYEEKIKQKKQLIQKQKASRSTKNVK